jgi:hypothetical protein
LFKLRTPWFVTSLEQRALFSTQRGNSPPAPLRARARAPHCTCLHPPRAPALGPPTPGFSTGALQGALLSAGFDVCTVAVKQWKKDLGLAKTDKEHSRALAARVFPDQADLVRLGGRGCTRARAAAPGPL